MNLELIERTFDEIGPLWNRLSILGSQQRQHFADLRGLLHVMTKIPTQGNPQEATGLIADMEQNVLE